MRFVAIDVETANPNLSSICQIGIVVFKDYKMTSSWQHLVDPEEYFDPWNVSIHGIDEATVKGSPIFPDLCATLFPLLEHEIVVCHTPFDRIALARCSENYGVPMPDCTWLDSAKIVRRTWPDYAHSGYGLAKIARALKITYRAHEAQEDARAAGEVVLRAISETGKSLEEWLIRTYQPITPSSLSQIARDGNPDGLLAGEVVVFTGTLSIPRREASEMAAKAGCTVSSSVTKETTLLIVGDQDISQLAGHNKSGKHRKTEELIAKGQVIRILGEGDFCKLVALG